MHDPSPCRYILFTKLGGEPCTWCFGSALLSFSIAALAFQGAEKKELQQMAMPGLGFVAATVIGLSLGFGNVEASRADFDLPYMVRGDSYVL